MIKFISQLKGNNKVKYRVYYKSGKCYTFTEKDNLPNTVLLFMVNSKECITQCNTDGTITIYK